MFCTLPCMNHNHNDREKEPKAPAGQPDPGTLHTTDPQEHMEGPLSSLMHSIEEEGEKSDTEDPVDERAEQDRAREQSSD
jgi:hypothetical protein